MKLRKICDGLYLIKFKDQYSCCSTMMRIQEFYESPSNKIRGKYFTTEQFMDYYAKIFGNFTYTLDIEGFNLPSESFFGFYETFRKHKDLSNKENQLLELITNEIGLSKDKFYVICIYDGSSALNHEIAHGLWHLDDAYKKEMTQLVSEIPKSDRDDLYSMLKEYGYSRGMYKDELQAYLSTSKLSWFKGHSNVKNLRELCYRFRKVLKRYMKLNGIEDARI